MRRVRYRTEAFSGTGERVAAEVMAFETFQLGNTDILETLAESVLKDRGEITGRCWSLVKELNNNGFVDDMNEDDQAAFMQSVLEEIKQVTGVDVRYALWLADKDVVTNRKWYGRDMFDDDDFDCYEVGPVVLSELGFDGTLYGYEEMPVRLEDRAEELRERLTDIINESENDGLSAERASELDDLYCSVSNELEAIRKVLAQKYEPAVAVFVGPLTVADEEAVRRLDALSRNDVCSCLDADGFVWGVYVDSELVGYCTMGGAEDYEGCNSWNSNALCLCDVFVDEKHRGKGYASLLVQEVISQCAKNGENVFITLLDDYLVSFYAPFGFRLLDIYSGVMVREGRSPDKAICPSLQSQVSAAAEDANKCAEKSGDQVAERFFRERM